MRIFVHHGGQDFGPYGPDELRRHLGSGWFKAADMAWHEGLPDWIPLSALLAALPAPPMAEAPLAEELLAVGKSMAAARKALPRPDADLNRPVGRMMADARVALPPAAGWSSPASRAMAAAWAAAPVSAERSLVVGWSMACAWQTLPPTVWPSLLTGGAMAAAARVKLPPHPVAGRFSAMSGAMAAARVALPPQPPAVERLSVLREAMAAARGQLPPAPAVQPTPATSRAMAAARAQMPPPAPAPSWFTGQRMAEARRAAPVPALKVQPTPAKAMAAAAQAAPVRPPARTAAVAAKAMAAAAKAARAFPPRQQVFPVTGKAMAAAVRALPKPPPVPVPVPVLRGKMMAAAAQTARGLPPKTVALRLRPGSEGARAAIVSAPLRPPAKPRPFKTLALLLGCAFLAGIGAGQVIRPGNRAPQTATAVRQNLPAPAVPSQTPPPAAVASAATPAPTLAAAEVATPAPPAAPATTVPLLAGATVSPAPEPATASDEDRPATRPSAFDLVEASPAATAAAEPSPAASPVVETSGASGPMTAQQEQDLDRAFAAMSASGFSLARQRFADLLSQRPDWTVLNLEIARAYFYQHDRAAALQKLQADQDKGNVPTADAAMLAGALNLATGKFNAANESFARAAGADPARAEIFYFWGECLRRQGKPQEAAAKFRSALLRNQFETSESLYQLKIWLCEIESDQELTGCGYAGLDRLVREPRPPGSALLAAAARALKAGKIALAADFMARGQMVTDAAVFRLVLADPVFELEKWRPEFKRFYQETRVAAQ